LADRVRLRHAAAVAVTGIGRRRVRPVRWDRAARVRSQVRAATDVDPPLPVHSWICDSRLCGRLRAATADIRAGLPLVAMVDIAGLLRTTADRGERPATGARAVHPAIAAAAAQVAAAEDTIQRRVAVVVITPVAVPAADTHPAAVVADTPVVAAIPAVIAKKLGDTTSLREAVT
jgi:hypothetical protein